MRARETNIAWRRHKLLDLPLRTVLAHAEKDKEADPVVDQMKLLVSGLVEWAGEQKGVLVTREKVTLLEYEWLAFLGKKPTATLSSSRSASQQHQGKKRQEICSLS